MLFRLSSGGLPAPRPLHAVMRIRFFCVVLFWFSHELPYFRSAKTVYPVMFVQNVAYQVPGMFRDKSVTGYRDNTAAGIRTPRSSCRV